MTGKNINARLALFLPELDKSKIEPTDMLAMAFSLFFVSLKDKKQKELIAKGLNLAIKEINASIIDISGRSIGHINPDKTYVVDAGYSTDYSVAAEIINEKIDSLESSLLEEDIQQPAKSEQTPSLSTVEENDLSSAVSSKDNSDNEMGDEEDGLLSNALGEVDDLIGMGISADIDEDEDDKVSGALLDGKDIDIFANDDEEEDGDDSENDTAVSVSIFDEDDDSDDEDGSYKDIFDDGDDSSKGDDDNDDIFADDDEEEDGDDSVQACEVVAKMKIDTNSSDIKDQLWNEDKD